MRPITNTGASLAVLTAISVIAVAPTSFAQTRESDTDIYASDWLSFPSEATASPDGASLAPRSDAPLVTAWPNDFIKKITDQKQTEEQWRRRLEQNPRSAEAYRNLADALVDLNRDRDAEAIYRRAIQLDPTDAASYIAFGKFLQSKTRLYEAALLYQHMVDRLPDSAIAYEQLADSLVLVSVEDWPSASADIEAAYRQSIALNPSRTEPYYGLGAYLASQNRFAEATSTLRHIIQIDPANSDIYATLAAIPTRNQEPKAAAAIFQEGLLAQPNNIELYISFANWLVQQSRSDEAEAVYLQGLAKVPESTALHLAFADYLTSKGRAEEAKETYQLLVDRNAEDETVARVRLGDILFQQGRYEEAKAAYEQAILRSPDVYAYGKLGALLEATEGIDTTIALYQSAIDKPRVKDKIYFYNQIGRLLQQSGRIEEAIATYRKGLSMAESAESAYALASLLLEQQQYDEAATLYERFRSHFRDYPEVLDNWQAALRGAGRAQEAETLSQDIPVKLAKDSELLYRRAIDISPESGYFYSLLGDALALQKNLTEAEAAYEEAIRLNYDVFRTRIRLGRTLFEQGKTDQAESIYRQALNNVPLQDRQYFIQDLVRLYQYLGELYESANQPLAAIEFYRDAIEVDPYKLSIREKVAELSTKVDENRGSPSAITEADSAMPTAKD